MERKSEHDEGTLHARGGGMIVIRVVRVSLVRRIYLDKNLMDGAKRTAWRSLQPE